MGKKYILDTCIWMDHYENRYGKGGKPIGGYASKLFLKLLKEKATILFSESLVWELQNHYTIQEIEDMLMLLIFNGQLIKIDIIDEEHEEASKLSEEKQLPFVDCLNAIQARNHDATIISQDKHILENLSDITNAVKPESLID